MDGFKKSKIRSAESSPPPTEVPEPPSVTPAQFDTPRPFDGPKKTSRSKNPFKQFGNWFSELSTKQRVLFCAAALLFAGLLVGGLVWALQPEKAPPPPPMKEVPAQEEPKPTTEASRLTGVQITPELNKRGVTGVMIENSPEARPQSGLSQAGVVFEAIAEGGITRFLALFQEGQPDTIGPVRSVRPYYVDWVQGFDAPIAHAGGSGDALAKIKAENVKDLDQFFNAGAYDRSNKRVKPHNLYTSTAKLDTLKGSKGWSESTFDGFARKEKEEKAATPSAKTLDFSISSFLYNPHYDYDAASNTYLRSEGGKPHIDHNNGGQLAPKVVIANIMQHKIIDRDGHSGYNTIDSGKSYIFQDGTVTVGTWSKAGSKAQMVFKDANGAVIKLNPGQTWISAVGKDSGVKYAP